MGHQSDCGFHLGGVVIFEEVWHNQQTTMSDHKAMTEAFAGAIIITKRSFNFIQDCTTECKLADTTAMKTSNYGYRTLLTYHAPELK